MSASSVRNRFPLLNLALLLTAVLLIVATTSVILNADRGNELHSFTESAVVISEDWTLTDSAGNSRLIDLPYTLAYGTDGQYTLERELPTGLDIIDSPVFEVYSNYIDQSLRLGDRLLLSFPKETAIFGAGTGNAWSYVRLPADFGGERVRIDISCQLGDDITYLLTPPLLGSKATILNDVILESLPAFLVVSVMLVLSAILFAFFALLHRRLKLNRDTLFLAVFTLFFAVYVFFETSYAKRALPNGHAVFFITFMLLALMPAPLIGFFAVCPGKRSPYVILAGVLLCYVNIFGQLLLHCLGIYSVRAMMPVTHAVIIAISVMLCVLLLFEIKNQRRALWRLLSGLPMLVGGCADIFLLSINKPSFNNSLWFIVGVSLFIFIQFVTFISSYFNAYRRSVEADLLRDMAYGDQLTGIGNRNAYERELKRLGASPIPEGFCCIVADINNLKHINDSLGHESGDAAIKATGDALEALVPGNGMAFRTGGDEFVVLLERMSLTEAFDLAESLSEEVERRGFELGLPLTLAIGCGGFEEADGNIQDFIRRVDTFMYANKRRSKLIMGPRPFTGRV